MLPVSVVPIVSVLVREEEREEKRSKKIEVICVCLELLGDIWWVVCEKNPKIVY